jgi:UDP-2-acetamido-3-amino-2,3-dideoxy-glucuronate N-acetyltransferase
MAQDCGHKLREVFVHPSAIVDDGATVGPGTKIWHQSHVRAGSRIGAECTLGFAVYVDTGVVIGNRCKILNHADIYQGVVLEDDVFVGPAVTFTNDVYPRAATPDWQIAPTRVRRGASVGANATIICGITLGAWSMIGAGAVVTADVPAHALVLGAPARLRGWVCVCGHHLTGPDRALPRACANCGRLTAGVVTS